MKRRTNVKAEGRCFPGMLGVGGKSCRYAWAGAASVSVVPPTNRRICIVETMDLQYTLGQLLRMRASPLASTAAGCRCIAWISVPPARTGSLSLMCTVEVLQQEVYRTFPSMTEGHENLGSMLDSQLHVDRQDAGDDEPRHALIRVLGVALHTTR